MTIKLLNKILSSERVYGITLPFPPIAIPSNDGAVSRPENSTQTHYATIVLVSDLNNDPYVWEFTPSTKDELAAYSSRHSGLNGIELLVSRDANTSKLRIRTGPTLNPLDVEILASRYQKLYDSLYEKYMGRIGAKFND